MTTVVESIKKWSANRVAIFILIILGIVIYANALPNQMFWDDFDNILNNQFVQNWRHLPKLFTENIIAGAGLHSNYWRPILMLTFSLEWHLWGSWAPAYHLLSIGLHIANAVLLFYILSRLFERVTVKETPGVSSLNPRGLAALLTSILFLVHPTQTEAITYVSSLADPLSTFFVFSGIILHLRNRPSNSPPTSHSERQRRRRFSPLGEVLTSHSPLLMYALALLTKEAAIIMPAFLFLVDFFSRGEGFVTRTKEALKRLWPFAAAAAVYILLRATVFNFGGTFNLYEEETSLYAANVGVRILTFFRVLIEYFKIIFWPVDLHAERSVEIATSLLHADVIVGGLIFFGLPATAVTQLKRRPILSFGILWFLIGLAPVSNIAVPINNLIMEHWLYLPIIGIFLPVIWLGARRLNPRGLAVTFIATLIFFSAVTIDRNRDWRDPITFYNHTLQCAPNSYRIINNLGMAYADNGDQIKAEETYKQAIELDSTNPVAFHNLGNTYKELGDRELAVSNFQAAIKLNPEFVFSYNALASLYLEEENYQKVREVFESYLAYSPSKVDTLFLLAQIAVEGENLEGALAYMEKAAEIDSQNEEVRSAITALKKAIKSSE